MAKNDSVIEILDLDSPVESSRSKRKRREFDAEDGDYSVGPVPKHPLLDSITGRFQQNSAEREKRNALLQSKREIEKVHSDYLKQNVACPQELARASYAASHWAKKNGIKDSKLRPAQMNLPGQTGKRSSAKGQAVKKDTSQNNRTASKNRPSGTSTVTSASLTVRQDTNEKENSSSASAEDNISVNSLRNKNGELFPSHTSASTSDAKYICPILYCEAEFSSEGSLGQHMNLFQHSPCNPCRYARDSKLLPDPLCYKCPECDLEFNTKDMCSEHMNKQNHLVFYPPLEITAYLCPQCLYLFTTLETCWNHMETSKHYKIRFPFKDDDTDSDFNLPVAMAKEFVQDYISKCEMIPFQVQCLDCGMDILTHADFRDHQDETNNFHVMSALTDTVLADVFSTYLKLFSCDTCHRLFDEQPVTDSRHICAGGIVGNVKADLIGTTSEFVKCSALSLIASLKGKQSIGGTLTVGKVARSKKHNPSEILHFQIEKNQPEKSYDAEESVKRRKKNKVKKRKKNKVNVCDVNESPRTRLSTSLQAVSINSDCDEVTDVKVEPEDSHKVERTGNLNNGSTIKLESIDKNSFENLNKAPLLDLVKTIKQENIDKSPLENLDKPPDLDLVQTIKQEHVETDSTAVQGANIDVPEDNYELIENKETEVKSEFPYLFESEYTVYVKAEKGEEVESSHTSSAIEQTDLKRVENDKSEERSLDYLKEQPSTNSGRTAEENNRAGVVTNGGDSESDNDFMEISDEELVETITISESDSDNDIDMVDNNQTDSKIEPVKKKKKKKRKKNKSLARLPTDSKSLARLPTDSTKKAREKFIKFLNIEEKMKDKNPEFKRMPGRQAKTAANEYLERRKNKALAIMETQAEAAKRRKQKKEQGILPSDKQARNLRTELHLKDQNEYLISTEHLQKMKNIIFLDLDNCPTFFKTLPHCSTDHTFVWVFYGGGTVITERLLSDTYHEMRQKGLVYISERCGTTKDAADFALVLTVGKMDERLPTSVAFTIFSGDKGFCEVERQMKQSERTAVVINPFREDKDVLPIQLQSLFEV